MGPLNKHSDKSLNHVFFANDGLSVQSKHLKCCDRKVDFAIVRPPKVPEVTALESPVPVFWPKEGVGRNIKKKGFQYFFSFFSPPKDFQV